MSSASEHAASGFDPMDNSSEQQQSASKKKRNLPGTPDPHAEVIALSPRTLMATNRFLCEVCGKGFQRDQNLQLHRRGHNLPWKLKQREDQEIRKRVYVCPEASCVHHDPSRALGDLTGIKKHFFRKHGDKKWKCEKCSKRYAVQSDWKAHQKVCGTREYRCDCGTLFSRRDSFITHRAFCDALAEESAKLSACKQVNGPPSADGPDGDAQIDRAGAVEASSSPFSQLTSCAQDAEVSKPSAREGSGLSSGLEGGGVEPWTGAKYYKPNNGPGLSLCLGTGPGPGPPGVLQMPGCLQRTGGITSLGAESDHETMQLPAPAGGIGMFASLMASADGDSEPWRDYTSTNDNLEPWQGYEQANSGTDRPLSGNSSVSQFAPPSAAGGISSLSYFGNVYMPSKPSSSYHQRHSGGAQLPATALLQKAAMMGATTTTTSLFQTFGGDSNIMATKEAARHESLEGVTTSLPSFWSNSRLGRDAGNGHGFGAHGGGISLYRREGSIQELLNSLCSGASSLFDSKSNDVSAAMSTNGRSSLQGDGMRHYLMEQSNALLGGSRSQDGCMLAHERGGSQGGDKHEASRTTLDFLGIEGSDAKVGPAMGMVRTLSQREIASITTLSAGIKSATPKKGNMQAGHSAS